jgi:2-polyprenyl-3-methyl-5-hydroxy-6-metoxy-1,4-benzoquinol methylase
MMDNEKKIIDSWNVNASNWINIIDENGIASRVAATNKAIIDSICKADPKIVLDIGCGEGWLLKQLSEEGIQVMGIDAVPALIESAKQKVAGDLLVGSYEDIAAGKINFPVIADTIVINFALIGKESVSDLLAALPSFLSPGGKLFIQTLHPYTKKPDDYISGWKTGSWDGLGDQFTMPYQWYFRTMEDWLALLKSSGFNDISITDIVHPQTGRLLSVIFECETHK